MNNLSVKTWETVERVVGTWLLALIVLLTVLLAVVVASRVVVVAGRALERGQEQGLTRQARAYPDPVCEWCGGIMDGHGCQCEGVER